MNVSTYSGVMQIVAIVFLLTTAVLLARRAYSAWRGGRVFAVLIVTTASVFAIWWIVNLSPSDTETAVAENSGPPVSDPAPAPRRTRITREYPARAVLPSTPPDSASPSQPASPPASAPVQVAPRHATVPAGTTLIVRIRDTLSTLRNLKGDTFSATLEQPLVADGLVIAEKGATVEGVVERSQRAGRVEGVSDLAIMLVRLETSGGQKVPISTNLHEVQGARSRGSDAKKVGAGAAIGAAIGAIAGGGKGAAIGAGLGAGAGGGVVLSTRGKDAAIPSESRVVFYLKAPLDAKSDPAKLATQGSGARVAIAGRPAALLPALAAATPVPAQASSQAIAQTPFVLQDGTPVRMRLNRNLSSADAQVGETVDFEVLDEVKVGDVVVIARGGTALATVTEAQSKRRMARGGKLNVNIDHVRLVNNEKAALRAVKGVKGGGHTGAMTGGIVATSIVFFPAAPFFLFMHGKDITIPKGTEITAYVNGDVKLDPEKFRPNAVAQGAAGQSAPTSAPAQASLTITSTPPGAEIEVNGKFAGSTPSTLKVNAGTYKIAVTKSGFKSWAREVEAGAGASISINAELGQQGQP